MGMDLKHVVWVKVGLFRFLLSYREEEEWKMGTGPKMLFGWAWLYSECVWKASSLLKYKISSYH